MKKQVKAFFKRLFTAANLKALGALAILASIMAVASANAMCHYWYCQPVMPKGVQDLNK